MALWTSDKYIASIKKLSLSQKQTLNHGGSAQTAIRTNMHICVPVLIPCPIPGLIWVLSSYITSAMGVILVYSRTNMYICPPVLILCPIVGLIWVLSSRLLSRERKKTNNKRKKVADIPDIIYLTEVKKVIKRRKVATSTQTDENDFLEPVKLIRYEKR